jgi:hypothetical protein
VVYAVLQEKEDKLNPDHHQVLVQKVEIHLSPPSQPHMEEVVAEHWMEIPRIHLLEVAVVVGVAG